MGFVHVLLAQLEIPEEDDERVAYVIPTGVYYLYKYYDDVLWFLLSLHCQYYCHCYHCEWNNDAQR